MGIKERQERDREAVRRAILDAARELFVNEGYQNVSIRKIAERIEYSPAAIYGYFPSKDDIFFALAEEGFRLLGDGLENPACADRLTAGAPLERVRSMFRRFYEFSREYERFAFAREMRARLIAQIDACVHAGIFPATVEPTAACRLITMGLLGVAVMRLSDRLVGTDNADQLAADVLNVMLAGLQAGATLTSTAVECPLDEQAVASAIASANSPVALAKANRQAS